MTPHPCSPAGRQAALAAMARAPCDLLVVGGGITGCGLAREAALRGLQVALVEREDFGCGTSGRSSKLVHGGLRYLAWGDVAMVREAVRERAVLRAIAPHLVHPLPFVFPLYRGDSLARYRFGFWLYDRLGAAGDAHRRWLSPGEVRERAPGLRDPLLGGVVYGEYLTDDARLTLENALCAARHSALVANHAPVVRFLAADGRVTGARVRDALTGQEYDVRARVTVNATGPWAGETLGLGPFPLRRPLLPSKGIHLLFPADRLPVAGAVTLRAPGGRQGFAIRRWDFVYVGTTDVAHQGELDHPRADWPAVQELLGLVRDCFPGLELSAADVAGTWAGLRPLIAQPGRAPRDTSRHDEVWAGPPGLLTVAGGKLTTYRPMAARVMAHVGRALGGLPPDRGRTAAVPLPGADLGGQAFPLARQAWQNALLERGVPAPAAERVTWLYGTRVADLLRLGEADPGWLAPLAPGVPALRGEVRLAVEQEMALTLPDFLDRRTALLLFSPDRGQAAAEPASRLMASLLGWSEAGRARELAAYQAAAAAHGLPDP